jgi:hypothetical protein
LQGNADELDQMIPFLCGAPFDQIEMQQVEIMYMHPAAEVNEAEVPLLVFRRRHIDVADGFFFCF